MENTIQTRKNIGVFAIGMVALLLMSPVVLAGSTPPPSGSFTIAVLPDTQALSQSYPAAFTAQTQWIKDNRTSHNIQYVLHLGDVTQNNNATEWGRALTSMSILDGFVPYAIAPGNHDYGPGGNATTRDSLFNDSAYFGAGSNYATQSSIGGFYEAGKTDNSYHTFNAGGRDWIVLTMEFGPRDSVVNWADGVMDAHANHTGILVTHAYMYNDETRYDDGLRGSTQSWRPEAYGVASDPAGVNNGQELWDKMVSKHNFALTLNGHVLGDGTARFSAINPNGGVTHQGLQNFQPGTEVGGDPDNAYMRLYEVQPDNETVHVRSYSPTLDNYLTDAAQDFYIGLVDGPVKASYTAAVQADSPIAHYRLETTDAGDAVENLGTGGAAMDGTYSGSGPKASDYDGNDSTTIGPFADMSNWSVSTWVRPDSDSDSQRVFSNDCDGWNDAVIMGITPEGSGYSTSKRWTITHQNGNDAVRTIAEDTKDVNANQWYHLTATADGDKLKLYVDGELVAITDRNGSHLDFDGSDGAVIGSSFHSEPRSFDGSIAELALFDKAISMSDVTEHRMAAFRRVVAGNLVNNSATDPNDNGDNSVTVAQHAYPGIEAPGGNEGDVRVAIAGQVSLNQREGVLLATVTQNDRDGLKGTVEVSRNAFGDGYMSLSTTQAGFGNNSTNEININTAVAWFPFAGGWKSAHVNADGTLFAANGVAASEVTRVDTGRYTIAMNGVHSVNDGMLFAIGGANEDNIVSTGVLADGSWDVRVQDNAAQFAATGEDDPFSFVYLSYDSPNLIGGRYDGFSDSHFKSVGDFTMTRITDGEYELIVNGETPETGMLLLSVAYEAEALGITAPDDNFLTYEADGSGKFIINSYDLPGVSLQDTQFVWAFVSFSDPLAVPEPATITLMCLGGLLTLVRRKRK